MAPELTAGSSIMPQKHNLDAMELVRGKAQAVLGCQAQILGIVAGLPSGFNMDFQETKGVFMKALDITAASLQVMALFVSGLEPQEAQLRAACSPQLFATDRAYDLVRQEMPFRDAYRLIASQLETLEPMDPNEQLRMRTHIGAAGNLGLDETRAEVAAARAALAQQRDHIKGIKRSLLGR